MMKHRTRILSVLLALAMCLSLLPGTALADGTVTGSNTGSLTATQVTVYYDGNRDGLFLTPSYETGTAMAMGALIQETLTVTLVVDFPGEAPYSETKSFTATHGNPPITATAPRDEGNYGTVTVAPGGSGNSPVVDVSDGASFWGYRSVISYAGSKPEDFQLHDYPVFMPLDPTPILTQYDYSRYSFGGWYEKDTGEKVSTSDWITLTRDMTLVAQWNEKQQTPQEPSKLVEVWFNPSGGTAIKPTNYEYFDKDWEGTTLEALTDKDGKLPVLPTAARDGYTFDGWYTAQTGGTKVSENQDLSVYDDVYDGKVNGQVFLFAHWTEAAKRGSMMMFYPNGGAVTEIGGHSRSELLNDASSLDKLGVGVELTTKAGMVYADADGKLPCFPTVTREGYTFDGWYVVPANQIPASADQNAEPEFMTEFGNLQKASLSTVYTEYTQFVAKWTPAKDTCTVTYDWNGATFIQPIEPQTVAYGGQAPLYSISADYGHTLKGWAAEDGILWDNRTMKVTEDMTLYAVWDPAFTDEDDFSFNNSSAYFDNYNVSDQYLKYLVRNEDDYYQEYIRDYSKNTTWNGSCFGMSAVYVMQKGGALDVNVFQSGAKGLRDLAAPNQSNNVRDLVNFYMLAQITDPAYYYKNKYLSVTDLTKRYSKILSDIQASTGYSLLGFNYGSNSGHAIVAKSASNGRIAIWDPNFPGVDITLTISGGKATFSGPSGLSDAMARYNTNTELKYVMPLETRSQNFDASNLQSVFKSGADASATETKSSRATLTSTVGSFTVAAADGRTATVKNGEPSGDLILTRVYIDGADDPVYRYELDTADAKNLTVTLSSANAVVQVVTDDVYARVEAVKLNVVTVSDEAVTTSAASAGQQSITMVSGKLDDTWNKVTVTGSDTGFKVGAAAGQVTVSSDNSVAATVVGENADTWEEGKPQSITSTPEGVTLTTAQLSEGAAQAAEAPAAFPFTDVEETRWFRPAVEAAYNAGLVKGLTDTTYGPQNTLTLAESVTLAARIYAEAHGETAPSGGTPWYKAAYDYCVEKGVIDGSVFALEDMTRTATRFEMVTILDGAVPAERMDNSVTVEAIPDLAETDAYGETVYRWYRAGILTGDADGSFAGERSITRAEVAKILCTINRLG